MPYPDPLATGFILYGSDRKAPFVIVMHYFQIGTFAADQVAADRVAAAMDNAFASPLMTVLPADCQYFGCAVRLSAGGVVYNAINFTGAGAGLVAGESLPDYASAVLKKRTAVGGKRGRGRWFIGCVAEARQNTGELTAGAITDYASLGTSLRTRLTVSGGDIWASGHQSRSDITVVEIQATTPNKLLVTQRKRRLRATLI